jgi:hypothetical protein
MMTSEEMKLIVSTGINDGCDYIVQKASSYDREIFVILAAELEELPKFINTVSKPAQLVLQSRLADKQIEDYDPFLEVLFDQAFGPEEYKEIGMNDGSLQTFNTWANALGMKEEAARASSAVYSWD